MDDWKNNSSAGSPQPIDDMGPLPTIHAPQSFRPPETDASHFDGSLPTAGDATTPPPVQPPALSPVGTPPSNIQATQPTPTATPLPLQAGGDPAVVVPADDTDTAFDEEWVNKAKEAVERTHADPYMQSRELGKLKAQYIKLRYNKDVKVGEE